MDEDEIDLGLEDLLRTNHSIHMDMRMELPTFWFGATIFTGTAASNRSKWKIERLNGTVLQTWPKFVVPKEGIKKWLTFAKNKPEVSPPGGVGSTAQAYARFFAWDFGKYRLGVANRSFIEVFLDGKELKGRYTFQKAQGEKRRFWVMRKPTDQKPFSETNDLESTIERLKKRGHDVLIWDGKAYNVKTGEEQPIGKIEENYDSE